MNAGATRALTTSRTEVRLTGTRPQDAEVVVYFGTAFFFFKQKAMFTVDLGGVGGIEIEKIITVFQKYLSLSTFGKVLCWENKGRTRGVLAFWVSPSPPHTSGGRQTLSTEPQPCSRWGDSGQACSPRARLCSRNFPFLRSWQPQCQMASGLSPLTPPPMRSAAIVIAMNPSRDPLLLGIGRGWR